MMGMWQRNRNASGKKPKGFIKNNLYMLKLVFSISKSRVLLTFFVTLIDFGMWAFSTVVFTKYLFGSADMNRSFTEVAVFVSACVAVWLVQMLFFGWFYERFIFCNNQLLYYKLNLKLFEKACNVDIACYENTEFYNTYTKAANEVFNRATQVVDTCCSVVSALLSSIYVIFIMFTINIWIGFMALLPIVANVILGPKIKQTEYARNMERVPFDRRQNYVNRVFYLAQYAKDIRLSRADKVLLESYEHSTNGIVEICNRYGKKIFWLNSLKGILSFPLMFEGTWLIGAYLAMVQKSIQVSDFVVVASAAVSLTWMLVNFTDSLIGTYDNSLYIDNLHAFMNYKEKIPEDHKGKPVPQDFRTLELKNVSFRYEGTDKYVLKNINLVLHKGQIVSLVGHNGSGKSTMIKLIMRLYDPTEGEILLDGVNIKEFTLKEYRDLIGTAFQDYKVFSMSVYDNVIMGNKCRTNEEKAAKSALIKSGVMEKIESLPNGPQTTLTKEFDDDGVNLSIGEAQKVAISRAFAKKSSILLLDEPSSALDPIAEYTMYQNFTELCRNKKEGEKISIFISHRLSSASVADVVYLMKDGKITERGTHTELMLLDGDYADMFKKQAENYLLEAEMV